MVTGATGFVGRYIVRALLAKGMRPVCLVRSREKLFAQHPDVSEDRLVAVVGSMGDARALREAADMSQAAIHLVGIIINRRLRGQTYDRIHRRGTVAVVDAVRSSKIKRYVHMSALGTRADAVAEYHRTKWAAEQYVRTSELDWTIFRPSIIHGPDGEFMQLMKQFACGILPPVIPYFGDGSARIQPVYVKDVAHCFVEALLRPNTVGQTYALGGPRAYTWKELYNACRALIPGARKWKRLLGLPVPAAKALAAVLGPPMALVETVMPSVGLFRFNADQVTMSQEDAVCDLEPAAEAFDITMRSFEDELPAYADRIP